MMIIQQPECDNCLHLNGNGNKTLIRQLTDLNIIVCSDWLKSEVQQSFLKDKPIHMIYNWVDTKKFKENHDESIFKKYGLDKKKKILLSVSAGWGNFNTRYQDACRLANILPQEYQLVLVGSKDKDITIQNNITYIPFVAGTEDLSKLYSAALAFVGFSVQDTFGKVFAEAMLCGTPAIVFNATACPEVVGDTGYAVPPHDVNAMLEKIKEIDENGREYYSQRCKDRVLSNYDYKQNVMKYINIYESIINSKQ